MAFQCLLLAEDEFLPAVSRLWADWRSKKSSFKSLMKWSDEGKSRLKEFCIRLEAARSQMRSKVGDLLSRLAGHLQARVDRGHNLEVVWEYSSAFFLRQEKRRGARSWISAVRNDAGDVVTDFEGILTAFKSFYQSLFSSEDFADDVGCLAAILSLSAEGL